MMKKLMTMIVGAASLALSTFAFAGGPDVAYSMPPLSGWYIGADAGAAFPGNSDFLNTGPTVNAQIGYNFGMFRLEAAGNYIRHDLRNFNDIYLNMTTLMLNGYYDFHNSSVVIPFIGAGAGWLHAWYTADFDGFSISGPSKNEFAYQGIAGLGFCVTEHFRIDVRYRILSWTNGDGYENIAEAGFNYFF